MLGVNNVSDPVIGARTLVRRNVERLGGLVVVADDRTPGVCAG
jgi:hypothetical protein